MVFAEGVQQQQSVGVSRLIGISLDCSMLSQSVLGRLIKSGPAINSNGDFAARHGQPYLLGGKPKPSCKLKLIKLLFLTEEHLLPPTALRLVCSTLSQGVFLGAFVGACVFDDWLVCLSAPRLS